MAENYRFDAHCHIFTMKYAIKEVKSMVHDILVGTYPWKDPSLKSLSKGGFDWHEIKELLKQLHETIHAAGGSEEENLQFLQKEAKKVFPSDEYKIIPLMMDVFYMFAYSLEKDQDVPVLSTLK